MSRLHRGRRQLRDLLADVARERGFNRGDGVKRDDKAAETGGGTVSETRSRVRALDCTNVLAPTSGCCWTTVRRRCARTVAGAPRPLPVVLGAVAASSARSKGVIGRKCGGDQGTGA